MDIAKIKRLLLLMVAFILLISTVTVTANSDNIRLRTPDRSGNTAFSVGNMFPGDVETKDFNVNVSHKKPIRLYYHADIRPGFEKLAEVLKIKIYLPQKDIMLYDGLMRDMPNSLVHKLKAGEKSVLYRISAYLDTSVGNEYQNKSLIADFRWWYEAEPDTGGGTAGGSIGGGGFSGGSNDTEDSENTDHGSSYLNIKIVAEVILDEQYPRGNDFAFILKNQHDNEIQTVKNRDGLIEFDTLTYSREGVYTYYISQKPGNNSNIEYDRAVYEVTVVVSKQGNGYTSTVSYKKDGELYQLLPRFENYTSGFESTTPTEPTDPEASSNPNDTPDTENTGTPISPGNPKTGDNTNIDLYLSMFGASLLAIVVLWFFARRKKEDRI